MLKIRLRRGGASHAPFYRIVVSDSQKTPSAATERPWRTPARYGAGRLGAAGPRYGLRPHCRPTLSLFPDRLRRSGVPVSTFCRAG